MPRAPAILPAASSYGLSHGTLECRDIPTTRRFLRDVLGLQTLRHAPPSFTTWLGQPGEFFIACVEAGEQTGTQAPDNRWELALASDEEVRAAHAALTGAAADWGIRQITPLRSLDGFAAFQLQDLDGNWWGISARDSRWVDEVFARAEKQEAA